MALALPTMLLTSSGQAMGITDQIFLGHLGTDELAGGALGNTYSNIMWCFLLGTTTALDTLGSQAVGSGNLSTNVTWCSTAVILTSLMLFPLVVAQSFGDVVARRCFGQTEAVSHLVGVYCRMLIPGLWPMMWGVVITKYLQVQNYVAAPAIMSVLTFAINIGLNSLLIPIMGFKGAPLATTLSRVIYFLLMLATLLVFETWRDRSAIPDGACTAAERDTQVQVVAWIEATDRQKAPSPAGAMSRVQSAVGQLLVTRNKWDMREAWTYTCHQVELSMVSSIIREYLSLAIPGGFMLLFEASALDLTTVFAGHLGTVAVGSHSCMLLIIDFTYLSVPFAIATAATIRIGNLLGGGDWNTARLSGYISICVGGIFMTICGILIYTLRHMLGRIYSNNPGVITTLASIAPMAALMQVADGIMGTSQGVLRGCGHQRNLMLFNFIGFWVCGLLLAYLLCFQAHLGLQGLWWGLVTGWCATCTLNIVALIRVDWRAEMLNARDTLEAVDDQLTIQQAAEAACQAADDGEWMDRQEDPASLSQCSSLADRSPSDVKLQFREALQPSPLGSLSPPRTQLQIRPEQIKPGQTSTAALSSPTNSRLSLPTSQLQLQVPVFSRMVSLSLPRISQLRSPTLSPMAPPSLPRIWEAPVGGEVALPERTTLEEARMHLEEARAQKEDARAQREV